MFPVENRIIFAHFKNVLCVSRNRPHSSGLFMRPSKVAPYLFIQYVRQIGTSNRTFFLLEATNF